MFFADCAAIEMGSLYVFGRPSGMGEDLRRKFDAAQRYRHSRGMVRHWVMQRGSRAALRGFDSSRVACEVPLEKSDVAIRMMETYSSPWHPLARYEACDLHNHSKS